MYSLYLFIIFKVDFFVNSTIFCSWNKLLWKHRTWLKWLALKKLASTNSTAMSVVFVMKDNSTGTCLLNFAPISASCLRRLVIWSYLFLTAYFRSLWSATFLGKVPRIQIRENYDMIRRLRLLNAGQTIIFIHVIRLPSA